jgi:hypothetical protein
VCQGVVDSVILYYAVGMKTKQKPGPKALHSANYKAKDGATNLQVVSVKMPVGMVEALHEMGGDRSLHIRAAVDQYIDDFG